ncbi:hypothetical protein D7030_11155 [Flavobacteriaceae bacterium AU392]|nr:hypothetical protein D1817_13515 [Flavobacteriaceae bacterium]RKM82718.1 hypothetical protein D7030_11155 [Flavobacteriaceae bacterium AU392]
METSKFHQLCKAYDNAQTNFENYKTDCHTFSIEFVKEIKTYYEVPDSQFSLYRIDPQQGFDLVQSALIHAIRLEQDHFWHFGIGLTVCKAPETLPEELILAHLMFRKNSNGNFSVKSAHMKKEFEVIKGDSKSYTPFLDALFESIITSYNNQLQQFLKAKTTRKLGFQR